MALELTWQDGGHGVVVQTDGSRVVVESTRAAPPGAPLAALARLEAPTVVRIKVHDCRRAGDGFVIRGRWLDLSRALRSAILAASQPQNPAQAGPDSRR